MMEIEQIISLFKWMTIINLGLLIFSNVLVMVLKNNIFKMHSKLFGITENNVAVTVYGYLGVFKIFVIIFNIVPYLSLLLIR